IGPAGNEALKGVISAGYEKDPNSPALTDDGAVKAYLAWMKKYVAANDWESVQSSPVGYDMAALMAEVLRRCGNDLTRANVLRQATSLVDFAMPMLLPGLKINTSPTNYFPIGGMQME